MGLSNNRASTPIKFFTLDRWQELITAISNIVKSTKPVERRAGVACALALDGMRVGEICRSPWEHLDVASQTLLVLPWHDPMVGPDGKPIPGGFRPLKHGVEREIELSKSVVDALVNVRSNYKPSKWLISSTHSAGQVKTQTISNAGKRLFQSLGVPAKKARFHMLRHTSAMKLLKESGNDLLLVQKHLGHASIETTRRHYLACVEVRPESSKVHLQI